MSTHKGEKLPSFLDRLGLAGVRTLRGEARKAHAAKVKCRFCGKRDGCRTICKTCMRNPDNVMSGA